MGGINGFVSNYWYDADGERTVKTSGENEAIYVNYRASRTQWQTCLSIAETQPILRETNSEFSGGDTSTARFSLYVSPYLVAGQGGKYTKHIYVGSQRIVSKLGDLASYGADPRRIPYAGNEADGLTVNYKDKYNQQLQSIKDNYKAFDLPYNGEDNEDYVNGQFCPKDIVGCTREFANEFAFLSLARQFCCNDGSMEAAVAQARKAQARAVAKSFKDPDNYENLQFFYHPDHLGSSSYITNLDGEVSQHIEYVPFGEVFIEERNNTWNTPYLFNAKEFDEETGMYYYGARYYEPRLSLWMSVDRFQEKYPNISTYCFSANNPIGILDIGGDSLRIDNKNLSLLYIDGKLYRQNGIQYTDKLKGFTKKVVSALDVLRKGTEGASMISELQSSSNNFVIKDGASEFKASNVTKAYAQQIQNDPSATAQKEALLNNGIDLSGGSGGTISWNSHGAVLATSEGGQVSKETDLAHEMFHALDANRGLLDSRSENGIERSEWQAVFRENILREQLGRPLRTHYITNMDQDGNFVKGSGPSMLSDKNKPILPVWYKR